MKTIETEHYKVTLIDEGQSSSTFNHETGKLEVRIDSNFVSTLIDLAINLSKEVLGKKITEKDEAWEVINEFSEIIQNLR